MGRRGGDGRDGLRAMPRGAGQVHRASGGGVHGLDTVDGPLAALRREGIGRPGGPLAVQQRSGGLALSQAVSLRCPRASHIRVGDANVLGFGVVVGARWSLFLSLLWLLLSTPLLS